jgi:hypothetical protein
VNKDLLQKRLRGSFSGNCSPSVHRDDDDEVFITINCGNTRAFTPKGVGKVTAASLLDCACSLCININFLLKIYKEAEDYIIVLLLSASPIIYLSLPFS